MSDDKKDELPEVHGFKINANGHDRALEYLKRHMNHEQLKDMKYITDTGHGAQFKATHNGTSIGNYKLKEVNGVLEIHHDHQ